MKIYPSGNRVYIVLNRVEGNKVGEVYLPDKHSEESRIGEIMAIGADVIDHKVGDKVLVQFYAGVTIHLIAEGITDDTHRILNASNILATVER